jgi:hypothetical protein
MQRKLRKEIKRMGQEESRQRYKQNKKEERRMKIFLCTFNRHSTNRYTVNGKLFVDFKKLMLQLKGKYSTVFSLSLMYQWNYN